VVPTRNVVLTDSQAQLIQQLVDSGRYQNASEVIRDGLRLVEAREHEQAARLEALRAAVDLGVAALERGEFAEFSSPQSLRDYLNQLDDGAVGPRA